MEKPQVSDFSSNMTRMPRFGALLLAAGVSVLAGSCGAEDKSGACTGTMNGAYFRLEFANYLTDTKVDVRINGRFIGSVGKGETVLGSQQIAPAIRRLGEFPVCDKLTIDAEGQDGGYSNKLCSTPAFLSASCSGNSYDFCYETIRLIPTEPCEADTCQPFTPGSPACPCPIADVPGTPGAAWEPC